MATSAVTDLQLLSPYAYAPSHESMLGIRRRILDSKIYFTSIIVLYCLFFNKGCYPRGIPAEVTIHVQPVPRLGLHGAIPPLHLYTFME